MTATVFYLLMLQMTQPILTDLHPNEYSQKFHYYRTSANENEASFFLNDRYSFM